jgi:hypothetical protein
MEAVFSIGGGLFNTRSKKRRGKCEREKKLKLLLREKESIMGWTNILHTPYFIYFLNLCLRGQCSCLLVRHVTSWLAQARPAVLQVA